MMKDWFNGKFGRGRSVTREAVVQTPLRLVLQSSHSSVSIKGIAGTSAVVKAEVELKGSFRDDDGRAAGLVAEGIVFEDDWLSIESPPAREGLHVHYEVSVPFATLVHLAVQNGPVEISSIDGPLDVRLTNGPLDIEAVGGGIEVELANGPMRVRSCRGAFEASLLNGPMQLEGIAGPIDVKVNNGPISIEDAGAGIEARAHNGPIVYKGAVRGNIDMRSHRGGIVVELPEDARFELDAEAEHGAVHCDFDVKDTSMASSGAPAPHIVLRSDRGEIVLKQASRVGVS